MNHFFSITFILSLLFSITGCTHFFFQPTKPLLVDPAQFNIEYENINFKSTDNLSLHGWWFPAQQESRALILFLHGNAQNISTHSSAVHWLTKHQFDVFVFDYRGYGLSEGTPQLDMIMQDISKALQYSNERLSVDKQLFVIGQSLGASMGIYSIAKYPDGIDGAIFISPFSDYRSIAQHALSGNKLTWVFQWPLSLMINNDYRPLTYVQQLPNIPLLYLYSNDDHVIPPKQVKALFHKSNYPKYIESLEGGHNTLFEFEANKEIILKHLNNWLHH